MLFSYGKRYQCVVMQLGTVILNQRWGKKLNILEKEKYGNPTHVY